jgi:uncharacterized membrane protein
MWFCGISFPVITSGSWLYVFTPLVKKLFSTVCHQESYKCISVGGAQFLVCTRCLGIYTGVLVFSFLSLFFSIKLKRPFLLISISLLFMLSDIFLYNIGLYPYSFYIAGGTGLFSGSLLFIYILNEFENYLLTLIPSDEK